MLDEEKKEQKNLMIAMILVVGVLVAFNRFMGQPKETVAVESQPVTTEVVVADTASAPDTFIVAEEPEQIILLQNDKVSGRMTDRGSMTDLDLMTYRQTTAEDSPAVNLWGENYQASLMWSGLSEKPQTEENKKLTPATPVTLVWENDSVKVSREISLDDNYLLTFTDTLTNKTGQEVNMTLTGKVWRTTDSVPSDRSTVHEGFLGLFDNTEKEERYAAITPDKPFQTQNKGGWIGLTDKYWQTIWVPDQQATVQMAFQQADDRYVASFQEPVKIKAGETVKRVTRLFGGAKELDLINAYEAQGIPRFDLSIDFGWYYFLTKPFLYFLGWLYSLVGNMGIAILIFATLIRIALLPIATKSYESMAKMKKIQPKIQALQERFKDNRAQLQIEMMNLYK